MAIENQNPTNVARGKHAIIPNIRREPHHKLIKDVAYEKWCVFTFPHLLARKKNKKNKKAKKLP